MLSLSVTAILMFATSQPARGFLSSTIVQGGGGRPMLPATPNALGPRARRAQSLVAMKASRKKSKMAAASSSKKAKKGGAATPPPALKAKAKPPQKKKKPKVVAAKQQESSSLLVCMEVDCLQQGAAMTMRALKDGSAALEGSSSPAVSVESSDCLGMCGLGPCVAIKWGNGAMEPRGGCDGSFEEGMQQLLKDASQPAAPKPQASSDYDYC